MGSLSDSTAIVGLAESEYARSLGASELELSCRVVRDALADAGVDPSEVDALASFTMEGPSDFELARAVGMGELNFFSQVAHGGGAACGAVAQVAMAISCGMAQVGVVWRSRKRGAKSSRVWAQVNDRISDQWKYSRPVGLLRPVDEVALMARRYMHEYGLKREQLAEVALAQREHANLNPRAAMYEKPLDLATYLDARWISEPLCLYDNCLESDGAVALVIVSAERARDCRTRPVFIHSASQGMGEQYQVMTNFHCDDPLAGCSGATARKLWRQADAVPADVKVAQLYDAFSPLVLLSLETYGLCPVGEAGGFAEGGTLGPGGSLPVNTSGGSLSEAYVHGMNLLNEGVRQMRGSSTSQVEGADLCLVTSAHVVPSSALLLRN
ncbi:MAG: lipid-transfer protein [Proteobacteria bacterium]|nr:lipid-transfer protein [Pseudomonadota bacterium]